MNRKKGLRITIQSAPNAVTLKQVSASQQGVEDHVALAAWSCCVCGVPPDDEGGPAGGGGSGGGGGGGGGGGNGSEYGAGETLLLSIQSQLDKALADPNCAKIFGTPSSGNVTAANVLDSLIQSTQAGGSPSPYGSIVFTDAPLPYGASAGTTANSGFRHFFGFSSPSTVKISTALMGDNFGTSAYNAETIILHELGHVLANLLWKGDQITPDQDPNGDLSTNNTNKIKAACGNDLNKP